MLDFILFYLFMNRNSNKSEGHLIGDAVALYIKYIGIIFLVIMILTFLLSIPSR